MTEISPAGDAAPELSGDHSDSVVDLATWRRNRHDDAMERIDPEMLDDASYLDFLLTYATHPSNMGNHSHLTETVLRAAGRADGNHSYNDKWKRRFDRLESKADTAPADMIDNDEISNAIQELLKQSLSKSQQLKDERLALRMLLNIRPVVYASDELQAYIHDKRWDMIVKKLAHRVLSE